MKTLLSLVFLFILTVLADHHEHHGHDHHSDHQHNVKTEKDYLKYHDYCVDKLKFPSTLAQDFKQYKYEDNEHSHEYMKCLFEHYGFLDSHGHFDDQAIHEQLAAIHGNVAVHNHEDPTHRMVNNCIDEINKNAKDNCACRSYRLSKCVFKDAPIKWY
uniref:Odorant binding protein 11 n=1 Tax=Liriomyza sativae TaxID=127406 RepID=A0A120HCF7_LIRSA|nr:odorant binding protein 11 [Liriomyza sativae]